MKQLLFIFCTAVVFFLGMFMLFEIVMVQRSTENILISPIPLSHDVITGPNGTVGATHVTGVTGL